MNNKNIKMFFFDNDQTLFDHNYGGIRPSAIEGLQLLKKNGYKLALNTSRSYEELYNIPKVVLDLMDCLILLGGAYIVKDGKVSVTYLNKDNFIKAIKYLDENNLTYRYCTDDGGGCLNVDNDYRELFYRLYDMRPPVKKYEGENVIHLLTYANEEQKKHLFNIFADEENVDLGRAIETSPKGCNKGLAMLRVAKEYGYKPEELCAFGDSDNDKQMLEYAGLGIAMGNYHGTINEVADYVTDDISDEGIYKALKHFEFI